MSRPTCSTCQSRPVVLRGLCRPCYASAYYYDTLDAEAAPPARLSADEVVRVLGALGECTIAEAANALDVSWSAARWWLYRLGERRPRVGCGPGRWVVGGGVG